MNKSIRHSRSQGFTLVELLTVIAIIGILAGILIPTVGRVMENARKTQASSNGRQIALAYNTYALEGTRIKSIRDSAAFNARTSRGTAQNVHQWAAVLALSAGLNDATFWFIGDDDSSPDVFPTTVLDGTGNDATVSGDFTSEDGVAWSVVHDMPRSAPSSTTPLVWSRGYNQGESGWRERGDAPGSSSPWGEQGGHIAYLDGHVVWKPSLIEDNSQGDLVNMDTGDPTDDFSLAIGGSRSDRVGIFNE